MNAGKAIGRGKQLASAVNVALATTERCAREASHAMIAIHDKPHAERIEALDRLDKYADALDVASFAVSELSHYSREILNQGVALEAQR